MTKTMKRTLLCALAAGAAMLGAATSARAATNVSWSIGINAPIAPGVSVGTVISNGGYGGYWATPAPVYVAPAPVVYAPPPVVYAPAPVVYAPAPRVIVHRRPVVIGAPVPVVVRAPYWHEHRRHHDGY